MENQRSTVILQKFLADPKNREAFATFARKYEPQIKRCCLARGLQHADADDLTANILLKFFERDVFDGFVFKGKEPFYAWLDTVAYNAVKTFIRDRGRRPDAWSLGNQSAQESLQRATRAVAEDLESVCAEAHTRIDAASAVVKACVEPKTWQVFQMQVYEECPVEQVAKQLDISKASVYQAISRVKKKLRDVLHDLHDLVGDQD